MRLKAVLVDDEINNLDNLRLLLEKHCPELEVVAIALSADQGRGVILQHQPDLVFLDIQMPDKTGFDLLRSLPRYEFEVIFVTAYDQFGIQAVKFSAIDYLLKPIRVTELQEAISRAEARISRSKQNRQLENLMQMIVREKGDHRIALTSQKETRFVPTEQIMRCESTNNYTRFFLASGEQIVVSRPLHEFEELLSSYGFIRCHQSHLVNRRYIKSWMKEDGGYLLTENGSTIPVSRNRRELVQEALKRTMGRP